MQHTGPEEQTTVLSNILDKTVGFEIGPSWTRRTRYSIACDKVLVGKPLCIFNIF